MRSRVLFRIIVAVFVLLFVVVIIWVSLPSRSPSLIISGATTHIEGPLRADGWIDYVAALNLRRSEGVTSENNGAVLVLRALGPDAIHADVRTEMFRQLEMEPLPPTGPYLVSFDDFQRTRRREAALAAAANEGQPEQDEYVQLELPHAPWQTSDLPVIAKWLEDNQQALDLAVAASRKPHFHIPLVTTRQEDLLIANRLTVQAGLRELARGLVTRALLHTGEGRYEAAWDDLLAGHRLARFIRQGPTLIESLIGIGMEEMAYRAEVALVQHADFDAARIAAILRDLEQLAPPPELAAIYEEGERFIYLDCVRLLATQRGRGLSALTGAVQSETEELLASVVLRSVDWNVVLARGNEWYDRYVAACRLPSPTERRAAWKRIEQDLREQRKHVARWETLMGSLLGGSRYRTELTSSVLLSLLSPAGGSAMDVHDLDRDLQALTRIALALEAYRRDQATYPRTLEALVPAYLVEVPQDRLGEADFRYSFLEGGYLLYGVGTNRTDDQGHPEDDLVFRSPPGSTENP